MDIAGRVTLAKNGDEQQLAAFKEARAGHRLHPTTGEGKHRGWQPRDGTVSPEMLMAVTNREITAGRLTADDPIRQLAVKAAASPHLSHAEMVEKTEAKKRSEVSIQNLVKELTIHTGHQHRRCAREDREGV